MNFDHISSRNHASSNGGPPTLVTGANGFVGSAVVRRLLKRGRRVRAFVETGTTEENLVGLDVERAHGNLLDYPSLLEALDGIEIVHHVAATFQFAASPAKDPEQYTTDCERFYGNNLIGTTQMLLAAQAANVSRIVYTSTMACLLISGCRSTITCAARPLRKTLRTVSCRRARRLSWSTHPGSSDPAKSL
jgi:nucleoside-diphosphate-sugar epimerase